MIRMCTKLFIYQMQLLKEVYEILLYEIVELRNFSLWKSSIIMLIFFLSSVLHDPINAFFYSMLGKEPKKKYSYNELAST